KCGSAKNDIRLHLHPFTSYRLECMSLSYCNVLERLQTLNPNPADWTATCCDGNLCNWNPMAGDRSVHHLVNTKPCPTSLTRPTTTERPTKPLPQTSIPASTP
ncbi:hypothetical protein MAR_033539, partial [Mya arenaria]